MSARLGDADSSLSQTDNMLSFSQSVLNFILPEYFEDAEDALRAIFKVSTNQHANLLSKQRVSRAQKMMKPFVLRRRKDQVCSVPVRLLV